MEYFHAPEPRYVDPKFFFAVVRPLLFMSLWGRKRRVLRDGRAYRDYFTMRMQFDTTNAERLLGPAGVQPAAGARLPRPPLQLLRRQRLGPQAGRCPMNIFRRFQLSRDRSVTVANLVDELLRRNGDSEVSVEEPGLIVSPNCTPRSARNDAFLRERRNLGRANPLPFIAPTTARAFAGFWPSFAPAASRFR